MDLADKIRKVEALLARAGSEGERQAAALARQRLLQKIVQSPIEYTVKVDSHWKKRLFLAVCGKHKVHTYRYKGQKNTTTMVRISKDFMDTVLWPEFNQYSKAFDELANDIMHDLISKIYEVKEEDEVVVAGELSMAAAAP
jgi:hypothetical protein